MGKRMRRLIALAVAAAMVVSACQAVAVSV